MLRKAALAIVGAVLALAVLAGSAFADTKLNSTINGLIGVKYKSGGTTAKGFDCSGFTSYVFKELGISLPRTSASQSKVGQKVDKADLIAGDLVFFNTSGKGVSHVGIYVGDGKFAHASSSKGVIISELDSSYYKTRYMGARRVMSPETYEALAADPADLPEGDGDLD